MSKERALSVLILLISAVLTATLFIPKNLNATIYGSIQGKIIAGDTGKPLERSTINLYLHDPKRGVLEPIYVLTDKEGKFCFKTLEEGKYYLTYDTPHPYIGNDNLFWSEYLSKKNYNWPQAIILEKGKNVTINITVNQIGGSVSGRVLKGDGITPFPEVDVTAYSSEGSQSGCRTKEDGSFKCIHLIPADNYQLSTQVPGYGDKKITGIKVEAGKDSGGIDIIIDTNDPTGVEGIVTTADGKPLQYAIVGVYGGGWNATDENGKYSISGLAPGTYTLRVGYEGKRKIVEGVVIKKGEKTKINVVLDNFIASGHINLNPSQTNPNFFLFRKFLK